MTILVTGALGFIGSRLITRLANEGREVIALVRRLPESTSFLATHPHIQFILCDMTQDRINLSAFSSLEVVVHLAGATLGAGTDAGLFLETNELTTVALLKQLSNYCSRFIFASSQVVYGDTKHLAVTEDFPLQPYSSAYACSKVNCENWIRLFQGCHGGSYVILRFCGFIDGGGIVDYLIDRALANEKIELFARGVIRRDYLSSYDGVDVLCAAIDHDLGEGFLPINIGSGQILSSLELAHIVRSELGSTSMIELKDDPSPQGDFVFNICKARELLGFQPRDLQMAVRSHARSRAAFSN